MIRDRKLAAAAYTKPSTEQEQVVPPPTAEEIETIKTKILNWLDSHPGTVYSEVEIVQRVKLALQKAGRLFTAVQIREIVSQLIDESQIQEIHG